jgi:nucleoside-diphosphate-sugar epimerase
MPAAASDAAAAAADAAHGGPLPRIVITGVAGFIGSTLAQKLCEAGREVLGVDNFMCGYEANLAWAEPPGRHAFTLLRASAGDDIVGDTLRAGDVVVHFGAISALASNQEAPRRSYEANVAATAGLLEACRLKGVAHFIFASTSAIYENTAAFPTSEASECARPNLIYSLGKRHCEELVRSFHEVYGLPFTNLRFYNIYGAQQDGLRTHPALIPYLIDSLARGEAPLLHSDGLQQRDYVYVADLLRLLHTVLGGAPLNTEINVCSGQAASVRDIVAVVQHALHSDVQPIYRDPALLWEKSPVLWSGARPFPRERMREEVEKFTLGDGKKAFELLGWRPEYSLKAGIAELVAARLAKGTGGEK